MRQLTRAVAVTFLLLWKCEPEPARFSILRTERRNRVNREAGTTMRRSTNSLLPSVWGEKGNNYPSVPGGGVRFRGVLSSENKWKCKNRFSFSDGVGGDEFKNHTLQRANKNVVGSILLSSIIITSGPEFRSTLKRSGEKHVQYRYMIL